MRCAYGTPLRPRLDHDLYERSAGPGVGGSAAGSARATPATAIIITMAGRPRRAAESLGASPHVNCALFYRHFKDPYVFPQGAQWSTRYTAAGTCGACGDDVQIEASIKASFQKLPYLGPPNSIKVQTIKHVVYLSGANRNSVLLRATVKSSLGRARSYQKECRPATEHRVQCEKNS
jgi:hypothetical protein